MTTEPANDTPELFPQTSEKTAESGTRMRRDLIVWLALLPVIMGLLVLCGQVALLFSLGQSPANTASRLRANYEAWIYDLIPPINIPQLIEDIQEDLRAEGIEEEPLPVVTGAFWIPPTSTPGLENATVTPPVAVFSPTPEPPEDEPTPSNAATNTRIPSATASAIPSATVTASPTPTRTNTWAPLFTHTPTNEPPRPTRTPTVTRTPTPLPTSTATTKPSHTPKPKPTATAVPTKTNTAVPTATAVPPTATLNPTPTNTLGTPSTATSVPVTIVPPPSPSLVSPIADSSEPNPNGEGCIAYFGYQNDNATAIDIPVGSLNQLTINDETTLPPTSFAVGRSYNALVVEWNTGDSIGWVLGGGRADAAWCNP